MGKEFIKCESKIKGDLSFTKKIIIMILIILTIFVIIIGHFMKEDQGELKEIVTDWETPQLTFSGIEIISGILIMTIGGIIALRPYKAVIANIEIANDNIIIKYIDKKSNKQKRVNSIDVNKIQNISYYYNAESNEKRLCFKGNENMVLGDKVKENNKFEIVYKEKSDKLCESIIRITEKQIKGF